MSLGDKAAQLIYKKLCGSRSVSFMISIIHDQFAPGHVSHGKRKNLHELLKKVRRAIRMSCLMKYFQL